MDHVLLLNGNSVLTVSDLGIGYRDSSTVHSYTSYPGAV